MEEYQKKKLRRGDKVVRGPDWEWNGQDLYNGNWGTVKGRSEHTDWYKIRWNGSTCDFNYRYNNYFQDIIFFVPEPEKQLIPFFDFNFDQITI